MPLEVVTHVESCLDGVRLPQLATHNVGEGYHTVFKFYNLVHYSNMILETGFQLSLSRKLYNFLLAERAPPEGYFSQDYVM
jgi:hypothetical protein